MPPLSNSKHERFAQGLAKGLSQADAYVQAGYKHDEPNANRLTKNDKVQARVTELLGRAAENVMISREWVIEELIDNVRKAKSGDKIDGATANKALELLGKELGMFVERRENVNLNHDVSDAPLTDDEWAARTNRPH